MCGALPACDGRVMADTTLTIVLDLEATADRPTGTARLPDGTSRTFHGWLGLAEAIDAGVAMQLRDEASPRSSTTTAEDDGSVARATAGTTPAHPSGGDRRLTTPQTTGSKGDIS